MYYIELNPESGKNYIGKGRILVSGKKRLLISHNLPIMLKDRKGNLHRYFDGWNHNIGEHVMQFCGLDEKGFFALPLETKVDRMVHVATNGFYKGVKF